MANEELIEKQKLIREAAEHELCETLGYWYGIKRVDIENAVGLLLGKLTEKGAVLIVSADDIKDKGVHLTAPLIEK